MSADDPFGDLPGVEPIYNSYAVDPVFARKFTYAWSGALGACIVLSLPFVIRSAWHRGLGSSWLLGIREDWSAKSSLDEKAKVSSYTRRRRSMIDGVLYALFSPLRFTIPFVELNLGQLIVLIGYLITLILCIVTDAQLLSNSNRAGFLALAQLPPLFLFASKNSILSLLLGPGASYDRLSWLHKAFGRGLFVAVAVHGSLWIRDRLMYDNPILGQQKETSGIAAFGVLGCIVLLTVRPFRQRFYQAFFAIHVISFPAFFITICTHTPYAAPWIYPPIALYAFDLVLRLLKFRVKDATLSAPDNQMTIISIHDAHAGFTAGQHVRLRVFGKGRIVFESHPLTILCAPAGRTVLGPEVVQPGSLVLAARACGDWSRALNDIARSDKSSDPLLCADELTPLIPDSGVPVQVMLDGPYGGPSIDVGDSEHVLLLAGGSGITFALGVLDDLLGRIVRDGGKGGERTRRVELAWCIRSFGAMGWVVPHFRALAAAAKRDTNIELRFTVFVTCLCDPEAVPDIPGLEVTIERPVPRRMLSRFVRNERLVGCGCEAVDAQEGAEKEGFELGSEKGAGITTEVDVGSLEKGGDGQGEVVQGGVAVCVAGPESLVREAANAVGRLGVGEQVRMGGVDLHCEVYAM